MPSDVTVKIRVDDTEFKKTKGAVMEATRQMVANMRRTAQLGMTLTQAFSTGLDQTLQLAIESAMLSVELLTSTATAYALGNPLLTVRSAMQLSAIISMLVMIRQLKTFQKENIRKTQGIVSVFRMLSF